MSTILIAYERELEQIALERVLMEKGHTVVRSNNGVDALDSARREPPQLAVCDILLPKLDGFSLCKKWKQDAKLQAVPFMFYTRKHDDPKYQRFALEVGADRYLERSSDPQQLLNMIEEVLAQGVRNMPDTLRAMNTGTFSASGAFSTGSFMRTGAQPAAVTSPLPSPPPNPPQSSTTSTLPTAVIAGQDGALAASLARESRLLSRVNEFDALIKQLQTSEERLKHTIANTERTNDQMADSYRTLLIAASDGYWLLDGNDRLIEVNEAYCNFSGYSKDELLKMSASDLEVRLHGEHQSRLEINREQQRSHYETRHRRKNGSEFSVEVGIGVLSGAQPRTIAIIRDTSARERHLAQQQAHQRLQHLALEAAFELVTQGDNVSESELTRRATEMAASVTDSPIAFLCGYDNDKRTPELIAAFDSTKNAAVTIGDAARSLAADNFLAQKLVEGRVQLLEQAPADILHVTLPRLHRLLCLPLVDGKQVVGMLCVANRSNAYQTIDSNILEKVGEALINIQRNKRNSASTLVSAQRADVALHGVIEVLSRVVERHAPYAAGGQRRVAVLAVAIARELGLDQSKQNTLRNAGLLHGVGNIAIPSALFGKPSALNATELALVRTHVEEGYKILGEIEFSGPVAEIVYQHHERLDGSGYPRNLKGDQIGMEARILAVADVVEAMCAWRPHRPALSIDAALKEIEQGRERLYDARVVDACLRLFREQGFVFSD